MKAAYVIGVGALCVVISNGVWLGCSSDNPSGPTDGGVDSMGSSGSSSGNSSGSSGSSSGSGSSTGSGSGSSGGSSSGSNVTDAGADATALGWSRVYTEVISPYCAGCHGKTTTADGGPRGGIRLGHLDLSTVDAGWANLINIQAQGTGVGARDYQDAAVCGPLAEAGVPGTVRVVPGDAGASLLYLKVHGFDVPAPCGSPMPEPAPGPGMIDDAGGQAAAAAEIRDWIGQGALP